nr:signal peptide peptidase-like 1 [Quercus suber]
MLLKDVKNPNETRCSGWEIHFITSMSLCSEIKCRTYSSLGIENLQATSVAIPAMLLALVFNFDHRKIRDSVNLLDINSSKGHKYIWYAPYWVCHWTGNCFSCWCFDSLTSTCTSVSGTFYSRTYCCDLLAKKGANGAMGRKHTEPK